MGGEGVRLNRRGSEKERKKHEDRSRGRAEESGCTVVAKETEKKGRNKLKGFHLH